jgi:hypothetical protein
MNIFACDESPIEAAISLPDKLIVKMPIESAQLLCTALRVSGIVDIGYKNTHINHPCSKWLLESTGNMQWLWRHGKALCEEYTRRYGRRHACENIIDNVEPFITQNSPRTEFRQCMPDQYKGASAIKAYRAYMIAEKSYYAKWKLGNKPEWWT